MQQFPFFSIIIDFAPASSWKHVQDSNNNESRSNAVKPSQSQARKGGQKQTQAISSTGKLHSNYISFIPKDAEPPTPSPRSNLSYDDTPRIDTIRPPLRCVEANNPAHLPALKIESYHAIPAGEHGHSALQHWLTDMEQDLRAGAPPPDHTTPPAIRDPGPQRWS